MARRGSNPQNNQYGPKVLERAFGEPSHRQPSGPANSTGGRAGDHGAGEVPKKNFAHATKARAIGTASDRIPASISKCLYVRAYHREYNF